MSRRWSWQKLNQMRRLWRSDMRKRDIADALGTSVGHLYRVARRNGLAIQPPPKDRPKRAMPEYTPPGPGWPTREQLMAGR